MIVAVIAAATVVAAPVVVRGLGLMAFMFSAAVSSRVPAVVSTSILRRVAIAIFTTILGCVAVVVREAVAVMIIACGRPNFRESRILAQTCIVAVSPFPILVPALAA